MRGLRKEAHQGPSFIRCIVIEKDPAVIRIIQHHQPAPISWIAQPLIYELENIHLRVVPSRNLHGCGNILVALFQPRLITGVNPKNPCVWCGSLYTIRILGGYLGFSNGQWISCYSKGFLVGQLTQRRPTPPMPPAHVAGRSLFVFP